VRIIKNNNILLIEKSLKLLLHDKDPRDGYDLARTYCENYNSKCGDALNGKSVNRIHEIVRFMYTTEACEDDL